mmetsp:Transcript_8075/g.10347  ORF Transcript_8075/g.10347 Transcript_8075/m.10347 type:complete len:112 (+) Transcript_8075:105-440(+)
MPSAMLNAASLFSSLYGRAPCMTRICSFFMSRERFPYTLAATSLASMVAGYQTMEYVNRRNSKKRYQKKSSMSVSSEHKTVMAAAGHVKSPNVANAFDDTKITRVIFGDRL